MIQKERLNDHSKSGIWQKYCGFLDLSSAQIMQIQKHMILERLKYFNQSRLVSKVIGDINLKTIDDFRQQIPLTTYADYRAYIGDCQEEHLSTNRLAGPVPPGEAALRNGYLIRKRC